MEPIIRNHFTTVAGRRVHYRTAGQGPVVVMLHASPNSAKVMDKVQTVFAGEFTTLAIDLPGYGLSDPLEREDLRTEDLADAIVELLDELAIEQVALYGRHTGAGIAVEIAHRHPARVSMVLTDGFPVFSKPYPQERLDHYLGRIDPVWDGSHLLWVWFRSRDIFVFWPWDRREAAARADRDVPSADGVHRAALELLEAGNGFRKVYASAFKHAGLRMIDQVEPPVCFGNRPGDSQFHTMSQYPPSAWTMEFPRDEIPAALAEREVLLRHPARGRFARKGDFSGESCPEIGYLDFGDSQMLVRTRGKREADSAALLLHDLPGSSALHLPLLDALGETGFAIAVDLMGQGESRAVEIGVDLWRRQLEHLVDAFGLCKVRILSIGAAAPAAIEFALSRPDIVSLMVLQSPPAFHRASVTDLVERYPVWIEPEWDGSHLTRLFHHLRDQELWWPWYERTRSNIRVNEPRIDPHELTLRVRECAKQPRNYRPVLETMLAYPLLDRLPQMAVETRVASAPSDLFSKFAAAAAAGTAAGSTTTLSDDRPTQFQELLQLIR